MCLSEYKNANNLPFTPLHHLHRNDKQLSNPLTQNLSSMFILNGLLTKQHFHDDKDRKE